MQRSTTDGVQQRAERVDYLETTRDLWGAARAGRLWVVEDGVAWRAGVREAAEPALLQRRGLAEGTWAIDWVFVEAADAAASLAVADAYRAIASQPECLSDGPYCAIRAVGGGA